MNKLLFPLSSLTLIAAVALAQTGSKPLVTPPAKPPVSDPEPPAETARELITAIRVIGEPTTVEELLDALEIADKDIRTFQSSVMYDRRFALQGDRHIRYGKLFYAVTGEARPPVTPRPRRTFAIDFDTLFIDGVKRPDRNTWVFDGEWLVEKRPTAKQYIARQVARPDSPIDPLGLGESPIPFPIGQRKAAILARYQATMTKAEDGLYPTPDADDDEKSELESLRAGIKDTYQLRLVPLPERGRNDEFTEIRLWYTRDDFMPRMARTINRAGDEAVVLLINGIINEELPENAIRIEPPPNEEGWDRQIDSGRFLEEAPPATPSAPAKDPAATKE